MERSVLVAKASVLSKLFRNQGSSSACRSRRPPDRRPDSMHSGLSPGPLPAATPSPARPAGGLGPSVGCRPGAPSQRPRGHRPRRRGRGRTARSALPFQFLGQLGSTTLNREGLYEPCTRGVPARTRHDPSSRKPSLAYAAATSSGRPQPTAEGCDAPCRSCTHSPPGTSPTATSRPDGPGHAPDAPGSPADCGTWR